jgi:hypothetical protein
MESGDFGDNLEIFLNAQYKMQTGSFKEGLQIIQTLRHRIMTSGEVKSTCWLIPTLDIFLSQNELPELKQCSAAGVRQV